MLPERRQKHPVSTSMQIISDEACVVAALSPPSPVLDLCHAPSCGGSVTVLALYASWALGERCGITERAGAGARARAGIREQEQDQESESRNTRLTAGAGANWHTANKYWRRVLTHLHSDDEGQLLFAYAIDTFLYVTINSACL